MIYALSRRVLTAEFLVRQERNVRSFWFMDYIDQVLEKLREWAERLVEALFGPQASPEAEPIPVPVDERRYRSDGRG